MIVVLWWRLPVRFVHTRCVARGVAPRSTARRGAALDKTCRTVPYRPLGEESEAPALGLAP